MHQILCHEYEYESPTPTSHTCTRDFVTTNTKIQSRRQARYGTRYFVTSNVPIFKINWNNKVYAALKREKYITKLFDWNKEVLHVILKRKNILPNCYAWHWKKKKYITWVFVFKPCLFHSEGGLMFVMFLLTRVLTCANV